MVCAGVLAVASSGCEEQPAPEIGAVPNEVELGSGAEPAGVAPKRQQVVELSPKQREQLGKRVPEAPTAKKHAEIAWTNKIQWRDWDAGRAEAKQSKRPICLVMYADWCPKCRSLAPAFETPKILEMSKKMVMIRANSDHAPPELSKRLATYGTYVPRIFFLKPDGTVNAGIKSTNARFPYFYTKAGLSELEKSMSAALKG